MYGNWHWSLSIQARLDYKNKHDKIINLFFYEKTKHGWPPSFNQGQKMSQIKRLQAEHPLPTFVV